jgi:hypothetical protein
MDDTFEQKSSTTTSVVAMKRKNLTVYWGIELNQDLFDHPDLIGSLVNHPQLIPLKHIHSTLLYVGKKENNPLEEIFRPLEQQDCYLILSHYGCSDEAMTIIVDQMTYKNGTEVKNVPSYVPQQHITLALKPGVKPIDSVNCLQQSMLSLKAPIEVRGHIKRFLY